MADDLKFGIDLEPNLEAFEKSWKKQEDSIQQIIDKHEYKIKLSGVADLDAIEKQLERITKLQSQSAKPLTAYRAGQLANQREIMLLNQQATAAEVVRAAKERANAEEQKALKQKAQAEAAQIRLNKAQEKSILNTTAQTKAFRTQAGVLNGLKQYMNAYLSILGIKRLVDNIKDITSEFELQRVSLRALTQDANFANELFEKIKANAVESPFSVKDMIGYTKQLAAYRVENENLYETMNMLADVSAGLGVDMSRLILAYGQVKAASVLRGQELRQFTEAGIPLVDELAKKFTQLRGEVVSTGEVFELISKREVPFAMVADIFKDMTEEGGRFYKMQEKQAKSLYGVYENLSDKIQIALNKIGESNRGLLIGVGKGLGSLADNLSSLTSGMNVALTTLALYKVGLWGLNKYYATLSVSALAAAKSTGIFTKAAFAAAGAARAIGTAIKSIPVFGWIAAAISAIVTALDLVTRKQREFNARLKETLSTISKGMNGIHGYVAELERLNEEESSYKETIADINKEENLSAEQKSKLLEANNSLARIQERRTEVLRQLSSIDEAFARQIKSQITDTEALAKAEEEYVRQLRIRYSLEKGMGENKLARLAAEYNEASSEELEKQANFLAEAGNIYEKVNKELATNKRLTKEQTDALNKFLNSEKPFIEAYKELMSDLPRTFGHTGYRNLSDAMMDIRSNFDTKGFYQYNAALQDTEKALQDFEKEATKTVQDIMKHADVNSILKQLSSEDVSPDVKRGLRNQILDVFEQAFDSQGITGIAKVALQKVFTKLTGIKWGKEEDPVNLLPWQKDLQGLSALGYTKDADAAQQRFVDAADEVKKKYKELKAEFNTLDAMGAAQRDANKLSDSYKKVQNQMQELKNFASKYGISLTDKSDKNAIKDAVRELEQEYSLVGEIRKRYEELKKSMSDKKATESIKKMYGGLTNIDFLSPEGLKKRLKQMQDDAKRLGDEKLALKIGLAIEDIEFDELKRELNKKLAEISRSISQNKEAADIFEKMLGITGDEQIATDITLSLTGVNVEGQNIRQELASQLATILGDESISPEVEASLKVKKNVNETDDSYIQRIQKMIEYGQISVDKVNELIANIDDKTLQSKLESALKDYVGYSDKMLKEFFDTINKTGDRDTQKKALEQKRDTKKGRIFELMDLKPEGTSYLDWAKWVNDYMKAVEVEFNQGVAKINFDAFKEKFADALSNMDAQSIGVLTAIITELKAMLKMPDLDQTMMKSILDLIEKASNIKIDKAPFEAFVEGWKQVAEAAEKATKEEENATQAAGLDKMAKAVNAAKTNWEKVSDAILGVIDVAEQIADVVGVEFGQGTQDAIEGFKTGIQVTTAAFVALVAIILIAKSTLWPLLVVALAVGAAFASIKWFSGKKARDAEAAIKSYDKHIKELERHLDRLQEIQEQMLGSEWIANQNQQIDDLKAKIKDIDGKIAAERKQKKKDIDEDKIADWEDERLEAEKQIRELSASITEEMAGTDLTSAAKEFAEAWLDAYLEFGNTTDAIKEKFKDMMKNMVVNSVLARVVQQKLKPIFKYIDEQLYDKEGNMIGSLNTVWDMMKAVTDTLPGELEAIYTNMGSWAGELRATEGELTGISKGVAQASEESVVTLSGYANSILYYHVQEATDIAAIRAILEGKTIVATNTSQSSSENGSVNIGQLISLQQDLLAQVVLIKNDTGAMREDITDIKDTLRSVVSGAGSQSPKTINIRYRQ